MDLGTLSAERYIWQERTIEVIKNSLILKPNLTKGVNPSDSSQKLAVIYGYPQIGKTTLILNMMGIGSKYLHEVSETLRAGIPRGNSSTSTAILYRRSNNELYGVSCRTFSGDEEETKYFEREKFVDELKKIRLRVEENKQKIDILHVLIPNYCFESNSSSKQGIDILDTPGVGSRNRKEEAHLKELMNKFLIAADVVIIACAAYEIQSLEHDMNYINNDWKHLPNEYIVVTTFSYSQESVCSPYFRVSKQKRSTDFYNYIRNYFTTELKKILGDTCEIEIFPVDLGDSLKKICEKYEENDGNELKCTATTVMNDIRDAVESRKNNSLSSIVWGMKDKIDVYAKELIAHAETELEEITDVIHEYEVKVKKEESNQYQIQAWYDDLIEKNQKYIVCQNICRPLFDSCESLVRKFINEYNFFHDKIKEKKFIAEFEEQLTDQTRSYLNLGEQDIEQVECIDFGSAIGEKLRFLKISLYPESMHREIFDQAAEEMELVKKLYPRGLFKSFRELYVDEAIELVSSVVKRYSELLFDKVLRHINQAVEKQRPKQVEIQEKLFMINQSSALIENLQNEIEELESEKKRRQMYCEQLEQEHETDKQQLQDFMDVAEQEYLFQYSDIIHKINCHSTAAEERAMLLVLLGLIEKDYLKVLTKVRLHDCNETKK